ncbi:hypothetical protein RHMOL_Rhmol09G0191100 [Rhododendron molle]|uniref:Uncharacterized protein n=3 Tax=Rhododendron molle TaxID=49168 RepID=A0ACC0MGS3_RHOML|nr:hypothetical protein RHMOL_Rhmol09G0191100 [Rhododendron molle]KAI8539542.1 hypothetical protein RHMOL_Rhmol09G0191100 [Rhododendron molle]KAI8539543.1 hypothetical protein RHMOL_Rhmol09G0191100 [Rhododendron molle]
MNPRTLFPPPPPPSFTFLPPPPNPNSIPTPFFFHSNLNHHHHHHSSSTNPIIPPPPPPPPPPDLPTTLKTLKNLINQSQSTLHSLSSLLPTPPSPSPSTSTSTSLSPCPFNPHHRLPPHSLFRHTLLCPSPLLPNLGLDSLRYPTTLQSSIKHNSFLQTLDHDPSSDLCFSLDEYCDFGPGFFYADCPGVVTSHDTTGRTFTLPGILSAECANYIGSGESVKGFEKDCASSLRLLPSELWLVRGEIEAWSDYPVMYSYCVVRAIVLRSLVGKECGFMRWVIVNSPGYGVVIDAPMRDHIVLLFWLCLKAIVREATGLVNLVLRRDAMESNPVGTSFKCPVLVDVLKWLSFQLSVLYGEVNGKFFSVNMLKQWILSASLNSSLFPLERKTPGSPALRDMDSESGDSFEKSVEDDGNSMPGESVDSKVIFVSQVAAAVAALHERSLLEQKIKVLRGGHQLTNYQRMAEHANFSKWADEERQKRSNYRPLLDHDGLSWQQPRNQDMNKTKTREELLAEERDYKRRRMSYRGKKLKRSTTQVMRDIIEKYVDDITQAGGIGCLVKGADEAGKSITEPPLSRDISTDVDGRSNSVYNSSEITREGPYSYKEQLHSPSNTRSSRFENESPEDHKRRRRDSSYLEHLEARRSVDRNSRYSREYISKTPDMKRSNDRSHDHHSNRGYGDNYSRSRERTDRRREEGDKYSEKKERHQRHAYRDRRSDSVASNEFEDRYDPSESRNMYEDDISFGSGTSQK